MKPWPWFAMRFPPAASFGTAVLGVFASAVLAALYAQGGWIWGFVMLVPWLRWLNNSRSLAATLFCACLMSLAFVAAVFAWFGMAIGDYTGAGAATGLALLLLAAPIFQPQWLAFALLRYWGRRHYGPVIGAFAGAAAWLATEWLFPKLLGDTLGHGLYPARLLRQAADLGGAAGLSLLLLLANEAWLVALTAAQARRGLRACAKPLALALLVPLLLAVYGGVSLASYSDNPAKLGGQPLRMGLVQSNLVDYESRRQQSGSYAVVRKVLDTHFAMSLEAVEQHQVDAVLWSETTYPTTFSHPKSATGAELDAEILATIKAAGVPFVFGSYDRDANGEYNAAAFVMPSSGLVGFYRKTRLFPFTEYVPSWLDSPALRRWLPWTGNWQAGNGARVFPLRLADGREIPVLPLICLDDVDTELGIAGARLGAQLILSMSNDAWFTRYPQGAALHQTVAAFRSIETRLPQFRVTTNGYSAVIDSTGSILASTRMGEQTLLTGQLPVVTPPHTLIVLWGNWVGLLGMVFLAGLGFWHGRANWGKLGKLGSLVGVSASGPSTLSARVALLPPVARLAAGGLHACAFGGLLWLGMALWQNDVLRGNTLAQMRLFAAAFLAPEAAAWCILWAFAARLCVENGKLVLTRGAVCYELGSIVALLPWRIPLPGPGLALHLATPAPWQLGQVEATAHLMGMGVGNTSRLRVMLAGMGVSVVPEAASGCLAKYANARMALRHSGFDWAIFRFVLLPFFLALPAFYLHQHITYGSGFGEYSQFGLKAYLSGFALWWGAWAIGTTLCAMALRILIEAGSLLAALFPAISGEQVFYIRYWLEMLGNITLWLGLPAFLLWRIFGA